MANVLVDDQYLKAIGDAIRSKKTVQININRVKWQMLFKVLK